MSVLVTKIIPKRANYEMKNQCSFKFSHYQEMFKCCLREGYTLTSFRDYREELEKVVILRHDLDYEVCVEKALEFAKIEDSLGARATYFVRLHSFEYNPFEFRTYCILRKIIEMGHEIGLHFECVDMEAVTGEEEVAVFRKEKKVLETILDIEIVSASQHGDYSAYSHPDYHYFFERYPMEEVGIKNNPFEDRFFKDMKYLTDSNSIWPEGCFCKHIGKYPKFQVLTHPKWWFKEHYHTW